MNDISMSESNMAKPALEAQSVSQLVREVNTSFRGMMKLIQKNRVEEDKAHKRLSVRISRLNKVPSVCSCSNILY